MLCFSPRAHRIVAESELKDCKISLKEQRVWHPAFFQVQQFLGYTPPPLRRILHVIMSLVVSGEFSSTWSISRPLLGLVRFFRSCRKHIRDSGRLQNQQSSGLFTKVIRALQNDREVPTCVLGFLDIERLPIDCNGRIVSKIYIEFCRIHL